MRSATVLFLLSLFLLLLSIPAKAQDTTIYAADAVEVQPGFPGGESGLQSYILKNLSLERCKGTDQIPGGSVFVSFIVEADGTLSNKKVAHATSACVGESMIDLLDKMPAWKPAQLKKDGPPVRCVFQIPIRCLLPK